MIQAAERLGWVYAALNSDEWLYRKKGYFFMAWEERAELLRGYGVSVLRVDDADGSVCKAIEELRPHVFVNGGDRLSPDPHEDALCRKLGVRQLFAIGGEKIQSSSALVANLFQKVNR